MEPKRIPLKVPPGLYRTGTVAQSQGRWFSGHLVRFWENTRRPVGGWRAFLSSILMPADEDNGGPTPSDTAMGGGGAGRGAPLAPYPGVIRKIVAWRTSGDGGSRRNAPAMVVGSTRGIALVRAGVHYDITPADFVAGRADSEYLDTVANESGSGGEDSIFVDGGYRYHVFQSNGVFTVYAPTLDVDVLLVGGGGGGGPASHNDTGLSIDGAGGGGGAGAAVYYPGVTLTEGANTVVVGSGGVAGAAGGDSIFAELTAFGGGAGGTKGAGHAGGCGGGGGAPQYPSDGTVAPFTPYDDTKYDHVLKGGGAGSVGGSGGQSGDNVPGAASYTGGGGGGGGMGGAGDDANTDVGGAGGLGAGVLDIADATWYDFGTICVGGDGGSGGAAGGGGGGFSPLAASGSTGRAGAVIIRYPI